MPRHNTPSDRAIQPHIDENTKIVTNRTQVDNGVYSPVYREKEEYKTDRHLVDEWEQSSADKRKWLTDLSSKNCFNPYMSAILEAITFLTDVDGVGSPSVEAIHAKIKIKMCKVTVYRNLKRLTDEGFLFKQPGSYKNISREKTPPKRYTLAGFAEWRDLMNSKFNNPNFFSEETNTYMCDEDHDAQDVCQDLPKREEKETKVTKSSRHIDADKVAKGDQDEIKAAAKAGGLSDEQTEYVLGEVEAAKGIQNWGGWLRTMIGRVKQGGWNMKKRKPRNGTMSNGYTNSSSLKVTRGYTETRREVLEQFEAHADEATGPELGYFEELRAQLLRKGKVS